MILWLADFVKGRAKTECESGGKRLGLNIERPVLDHLINEEEGILSNSTVYLRRRALLS